MAISYNGDGLLIHDCSGATQPVERQVGLDAFPSPAELRAIYLRWKGIDSEPQRDLIGQPYHTDGSGKQPRYYQRVAINRAVEAVARGEQRMLRV